MGHHAEFKSDERVRAVSLPCATRWRRGMSALIDLGVFVAIIGIVVYFGGKGRMPLPLKLVKLPAALVLAHLYLLLKDAVEGRSVGKMLTGLVAVWRTNGEPVGAIGSVLRNWPLALPLIGPVFFGCVIFWQHLAGRNRRLGDKLAGTEVVRDDQWAAREEA